jgi:hypothetical protein
VHTVYTGLCDVQTRSTTYKCAGHMRRV